MRCSPDSERIDDQKPPSGTATGVHQATAKDYERLQIISEGLLIVVVELPTVRS